MTSMKVGNTTSFGGRQTLPDGKQASVLCVEGPYACPVEESLGLLGAEELLRVFGDLTNEEPESRKLWAPDGFDPLGFDLIDTNRRLKRL